MKITLQLKLLGMPEINLAGEAVAEALSSKAQAILYYLATTGQPQPRAALATLLWGDVPESAARSNLRKALANLRDVIGDYLDIDRQLIDFTSKVSVWIDVVEFETLVSGSMHRLETSTDIQQLQTAIELYRGDFLAGFYVLHAPDFESWMMSQQTRLRELVIQTLHSLANHYAEQGAWALSISYIRRLLNLEPWREEAHRQLMLLLDRDGQRSAALLQFETCRQALQEELGVEPGPETVALYERIRDGKVSRPDHESFNAAQNEWAGKDESAPTSQSRPTFLSSLPTPSTRFVGRAAELADILRRLTDRDCRLLTLVGPGGIGKTRLAIQTGQTFIDNGTGPEFFAQGIVFVSLAGVSSIGGMISVIAEAANFTFYSNVPPRQQLLNYLQERNMLLILDNLEHLLDGGSELISEILAVAPEVKILVTSREALNLQEAWFHPVEGMSFPASQPESSQEVGVENQAGGATLEKYDAIQLFVQSAGRTRVEFSLAAEQAYVVRICQLVEGMPLGIELAATWLKVLPVDKIVHELEQGLDILSARLQNVPQRHRSIRAVFEHSWQLLVAEERAVLERLAVFRGSFTEEAAEQVAEASLLILAILVEKSLVRVVEAGRYQMHELLRQFVAEKLASDPQAEAITRERHSAYYLGFLNAREEILMGREQQRALAEVGQEIKNVRLAWRWAVDQGYLAAIDQAMESLYNFYLIRSRYQEGKEILAYAITQLELSEHLAEHPEFEIVLNRLRARCGCFHYFLGDYEIAHKYLEANLSPAGQPLEKEFILPMLDEIQKRPRWAVEVILSLRMLGQVVSVQGIRSVAEAYLYQSLALSRATGNLNGVAEALRSLVDVLNQFGDFMKGKQLAGECLAISRQLGQPGQIARALISLGWATNCLGEYRKSEEYWQESLAIFQEIGDQLGISDAWALLGWVAWCEGPARREEAVAYYKKALALSREIGHRRNLAMLLGDLTLAVGEAGEYEQAIRYGHEGFAVAEEIGHLDLMAYNLFCLGAAACGLGDFQTGRDYLIQSLKIAWEAQIIDHTTIALFYFAALLAKESDLTKVTEPLKSQQKVRALELLVLIINHPACWQPIKDRAAPLQAQLEAELPAKMVTAAKTRGKDRVLEEVATEILQVKLPPIRT